MPSCRSPQLMGTPPRADKCNSLDVPLNSHGNPGAADTGSSQSNWSGRGRSACWYFDDALMHDLHPGLGKDACERLRWAAVGDHQQSRPAARRFAPRPAGRTCSRRRSARPCGSAGPPPGAGRFFLGIVHPAMLRVAGGDPHDREIEHEPAHERDRVAAEHGVVVRPHPARVTLTLIPASGASRRAMSSELVTICRCRLPANARANAIGVEPVSTKTDMPSVTSPAAMAPIRAFSRGRMRARSSSGCSSSGRNCTAPPCTRRSRPSASSSVRSRRIVSSLTTSSCASSIARIRPLLSRRLRIVSWRWADSMGLGAGGLQFCRDFLADHDRR